MLSAFGQFNKRGGGGVLSAFGRFNKRGGGGCCPLSADLTSGGGGVLSIFGRFNKWGGVACVQKKKKKKSVQTNSGSEWKNSVLD